jgi:hypothetical protein
MKVNIAQKAKNISRKNGKLKEWCKLAMGGWKGGCVMPFGLLKKLSSKQRSLNKAAHSRGDESGIRRRWKPEVDEKKIFRSMTIAKR